MISREALARRRRKGIRMCKEVWHYEHTITSREVGKAGETPVPCSCVMCGNPRRKNRGRHQLTIQELRAGLPDE